MTTGEQCIHELAIDTCGMCAPRSPSRRDGSVQVLIAPSGKAHLEGGCTHKDDPDMSRWGYVSTADAWQTVCNGKPISADAPSRLVSTSPCKDCQSGPLG